MARQLQDDPFHTISVSIDTELLARLNTAARLLPESGSRSQLVRDLLNLSLDILLDPVGTLPAVVAKIKEQYAADTETR
ncbi:hypothetical protein ACQKQD_18005 [Methylobacterium sp. NPDC080182]|uniref:hypothetical protein n=1 Tax=Methylobacterium sp. NPDC080182 TaxID=3390590 RepID=UPI003CFFAA62